MKLKGFYGERVEITKEKGLADNEHDHLYISINGKRLGYFHISKTAINYHPDSGCVKRDVIDLKEVERNDSQRNL